MVKVRGKALGIEIFDPVAQYYVLVERYVLIVPSYILVFSLNDENSLKDLRKMIKWVEKIIQMPIYYKPIILVGSKSDLEWNVSQDEIEEFMKEYRIQRFIPTSARYDKNVTKCYEKISKLLCDHDMKIDPELLAKWEKEKLKKCLVM
jgi:GTPase SAR1 family protein